MVPSAHALRASLALKLWSLALKLWAIERKSHIMALVADEGLALFCGLNAISRSAALRQQRCEHGAPFFRQPEPLRRIGS
jgi:hypothetical protein